MPHVFETAPSGRSKCRACGRRIDKGELRFGERLPNPFAEGEMTLWFHPRCAAHKRPEPILEVLDQSPLPSDENHTLRAIATEGVSLRRLPRIDGASRAPSGRARCRSCREPIDKGAWRIGLVFYEEGMFNAGGFIHARCAKPYFDTRDILERVQQFSPELDATELASLSEALAAGSG